MNQICQSCAMPMTKSEERGTEIDASLSADYCVYCYKNGAFTNDMTLDEMIADSVNYAEVMGLTPQQMLENAQKILPPLKRWTKHD